MSNPLVLPASDSPVDKKIERKKARIRRDSEQILAIVENNDPSMLKSVKQKVAYILYNHKEARDNDNKLFIFYLKIFHSNTITNDQYFDLGKIHTIPKYYDIQRHRAYIQNTLGFFIASEEVYKKRRKLQEEYTEYFSSPIPDRTIYMYADESGKNENYLIFGGICIFLQHHFSEIMHHLTQRNLHKGELHFSEIKHSDKFEIAKDKIFTVKNNSCVLFFAIVVDNKNIDNKRKIEIINSGFSEMVLQFIDHAEESGISKTPMFINLIKDQEMKIDDLQNAEIKRTITNNSKEKALINRVTSINSKDDIFIQISDLFIGSLSRIINKKLQIDSPNYKDQLAIYVRDLLKFYQNGTDDLNHSNSYCKIIYMGSSNQSSLT
ncbi:DUF3800 domain-containing protein [Herpetosiphon llansteffanensis]